MSTQPKYAKKTDLNQSEIVHALKAIGCEVLVIGKPVDLLVGYRGRNWLIEVKRPGHKPRTPDQIKFLKAWKGQVAIVRTIDEALELVTQVRA